MPQYTPEQIEKYNKNKDEYQANKLAHINKLKSEDPSFFLHKIGFEKNNKESSSKWEVFENVSANPSIGKLLMSRLPSGDYFFKQAGAQDGLKIGNVFHLAKLQLNTNDNSAVFNFLNEKFGFEPDINEAFTKNISSTASSTTTSNISSENSSATLSEERKEFLANKNNNEIKHKETYDYKPIPVNNTTFLQSRGIEYDTLFNKNFKNTFFNSINHNNGFNNIYYPLTNSENQIVSYQVRNQKFKHFKAGDRHDEMWISNENLKNGIQKIVVTESPEEAFCLYQLSEKGTHDNTLFMASMGNVLEQHIQHVQARIEKHQVHSIELAFNQDNGGYNFDLKMIGGLKPSKAFFDSVRNLKNKPSLPINPIISIGKSDRANYNTISIKFPLKETPLNNLLVEITKYEQEIAFWNNKDKQNPTSKSDALTYTQTKSFSVAQVNSTSEAVTEFTYLNSFTRNLRLLKMVNKIKNQNSGGQEFYKIVKPSNFLSENERIQIHKNGGHISDFNDLNLYKKNMPFGKIKQHQNTVTSTINNNNFLQTKDLDKFKNSIEEIPDTKKKIELVTQFLDDISTKKLIVSKKEIPELLKFKINIQFSDVSNENAKISKQHKI